MLSLLCLTALLHPPTLTFNPLPGPQRFEMLIVAHSELDVVVPSAIGHALTARGWAVRVTTTAQRPNTWGHVLFVTPGAAQTEAGRLLVRRWRASGRKLAALSESMEGLALEEGVEEVKGVFLAATASDLGRLAFALDAWAQDHLRQSQKATGGDPP